MSENPRARKLADQIKEIVAVTLERKVKDPRLGFVTITDSRVTGDLQHATLFYTVLGSEEELADTQKVLNSAKGMIRSEVGRNVTVRLTPSLEFVHDALPETSSFLESKLAEAAEQDAKVRKLAEKAKYSGGEDPYTS
ncbi:MAG: 30S ribosome-binding factor RbfA [Micrococcaceae bacterium]